MFERETNSEFSGANIRYLIDSNGNHWICEGDVDRTKNLAGQACTPAEDWVYDRSFGG